MADSFWLPPVEEGVSKGNQARKGDADYGVTAYGKPGAKDADFESKHKRGGKGTREGGKFVKQGDSGSDVSRVQKRLGVTETGKATAAFASAVIDFQKRHGLKVDGVVGRQTARALAGDYAGARKTAPGALRGHERRLLRAATHQGKGKTRKKASKGASGRGRMLEQGGEEGALLEGAPGVPFDEGSVVRNWLGRFAEKASKGGKGGGATAHAVIPTYDGSKLTFGKRAGGSNGARFAAHADGGKWLIKTYGGNDNRVSSELVANAVYRELGARVPRAGILKLHNGRHAVTYPLLEGKPRPFVFQQRTPAPSPEVGKHFMADALLANWDVAGLDDDNILWDKQGLPFRVDQGGTFEYRAMGGRKEYGPVPTEVVSMLTGSGQGRRSSAVTLDGLKAQAASIAETLTPEKIDALFNAAPWHDTKQRDRVARTLKQRVAWMRLFAEGKAGLPAPKKKPDAVEEAFWLEPLMEAIFAQLAWVDSEHPRDQHGKFIDKLKGIPVGKVLQIDSKTTLKKDKDGTIRVTRSGAIIKGFRSPEDAMRAALDRSAKGTDAESVGGTTSHKDFNAFLKARFQPDVESQGPGSAIRFGGKALKPEDAEVELGALRARLAQMETDAVTDKYVAKAIPTVKARESELAVKVKAAGGDSTVGSGLKAAPSGGLSHGTSGSKLIDKTTLIQGPEGTTVTAGSNSIRKLSSGDYEVDLPMGGGVFVYTNLNGAINALHLGKHGGVEHEPFVNDKVKNVLADFPPGTLVKLPNGNWGKVVGPGGLGEYVSVKMTSGQYAGDKALDVLPSSFIGAKKVASGRAPKPGFAMTLQTGADKEQLKQQLESLSPGQRAMLGSIVVTRLPNEEEGFAWLWEPPGGPPAASAGPDWGIKRAKGVAPWPVAGESWVVNGEAMAAKYGGGAGASPAAPAKPKGKKIGKNVKQKVPVDPESPHGFGYPLKGLALETGDRVQFKKGGWVYEYQGKAPHTNAMVFVGPNGKKKQWQGYAKPESVMKASGYALEVGTPEGFGEAPPVATAVVPGQILKASEMPIGTLASPEPGAPFGTAGKKLKKTGPDLWVGQSTGAPYPAVKADTMMKVDGDKPGAVSKGAPMLSVAQIKSELVKPSGAAPATLGILPEGTVIETPDGKIAIMKPSVDAYTGYTSAYVVDSGTKIEVPSDKPPMKASLDPTVKAAAADHLAKANAGTKITTAGGVSSPKTPGPDVGPPAAFNGIASWAAAKPHIADAKNVGLTSEEKVAIKQYTNGAYGEINGLLRDSKSVGDVSTAKQAALIKKALRKGKVTQDVWIGRQTNNEVWKKQAKAGKVIQDNGVMSSSTTDGTWSGDITLNVLIRAGSNALHVRSISAHPGEDEVLMPPGSMFHVLKREEKGSKTVLYVEMIT